jgi:uncharacterized membrane protein
MISRLRAAFRARLWPLPVLAVVVAVALGVGLPALDDFLDRRVPGLLQVYVFSGGPDAARAVLQAISGSLITVTSLTFSLTVVTLQLASSQFSPRLLRTFTSDRFVHWTLALFLGTFSYALTVLRSVRSDAAGNDEFVPALAVTVALALALASVIGLVLFLAHLTREIRVETMMKNVHAETAATIERLIPRDRSPQPDHTAPPGGQRVAAVSSGFLNSVDSSRLVRAAREAGAVVRIDAWPGESLIAGVPFATVWAAGERRTFTAAELKELAGLIGGAVTIGFERTNEQDPAFGFRQLADVGARALSPGTNDPTTAVHVIGHLSSLLCVLAERELSDEAATDGDGVVRAILAKPGFEHFLSLAVSQIRHYGMQDADVGKRLLALFEEVSWCDSRGALRAALETRLSELRESIEHHEYSSAEQRALAEKYEHVRLAVTSMPHFS